MAKKITDPRIGIRDNYKITKYPTAHANGIAHDYRTHRDVTVYNLTDDDKYFVTLPVGVSKLHPSILKDIMSFIEEKPVEKPRKQEEVKPESVVKDENNTI